MIELLGSSAFGAALLVGFRHGFDWDHLAALTDLTGSQASSKRSMWLATLYALGHAVMVLALGAVAILFAEQVPASVDAVMERLVGVSLLALGAWIACTAVRTRGAPPVRSRWMVLIEVTGRAIRRRGDAGELVEIEHSHPHDHDHPLHGHAHSAVAVDEAGAGRGAVAIRHSHVHRHVAVAPRDPFVRYGNWSSFGVGLLHGVGAETPTQVLVFTAAAHANGRPTSVALLGCFVAGLVVANTVVAAASTFGFGRVLGHRAVAVALAVVTAAFSVVVGSLLVAGRGPVFPTILG